MITSAETCAKLITALLFACFSSCFLVQVHDQVSKFLGGATVTLTRQERVPHFR